MTEYISGEKHREMTAKNVTKNAFPKPLLGAIIVILLMSLSFYGGVAYQKSHHPAVSTTSTRAGGPGAGFAGQGRFGGQRPTIGQVTAVSATSITVQDSRSGASMTLGISSSTQISDNGQAVAASDITVGENVLVTASTTDKTQAARILVNPSFGGGPQSSSGGSSAPTATN